MVEDYAGLSGLKEIDENVHVHTNVRFLKYLLKYINMKIWEQKRHFSRLVAKASTLPQTLCKFENFGPGSSIITMW